MKVRLHIQRIPVRVVNCTVQAMLNLIVNICRQWIILCHLNTPYQIKYIMCHLILLKRKIFQNIFFIVKLFWNWQFYDYWRKGWKMFIKIFFKEGEGFCKMYYGMLIYILFEVLQRIFDSSMYIYYFNLQHWAITKILRPEQLLWRS
jgi:hypothetical protein